MGNLKKRVYTTNSDNALLSYPISILYKSIINKLIRQICPDNALYSLLISGLYSFL